MITARTLTVSRGEHVVLKDFSMQIHPGQITAILGPNGSGKSTLLAALSGDIAVASGEITIDDRLLADYDVAGMARVRSVCLQSQKFSLAFTVEQVLAISILRSGNTESMNRAVIALDIATLLPRTVISLSGGEQQRVAIAMAIAQATPYLFLDEPFAAQDLASAARIKSYLRTLASQGVAIVVVAHVEEDTLEWCDVKVRLDPR